MDFKTPEPSPYSSTCKISPVKSAIDFPEHRESERMDMLSLMPSWKQQLRRGPGGLMFYQSISTCLVDVLYLERLGKIFWNMF